MFYWECKNCGLREKKYTIECKSCGGRSTFVEGSGYYSQESTYNKDKYLAGKYISKKDLIACEFHKLLNNPEYTKNLKEEEIEALWDKYVEGLSLREVFENYDLTRNKFDAIRKRLFMAANIIDKNNIIINRNFDFLFQENKKSK